jgi:hypothetical protein
MAADGFGVDPNPAHRQQTVSTYQVLTAQLAQIPIDRLGGAETLAAENAAGSGPRLALLDGCVRNKAFRLTDAARRRAALVGEAKAAATAGRAVGLYSAGSQQPVLIARLAD